MKSASTHRATVELRDRVEQAIRDVRDGQMVLVVDDEDRENEGDLIMAAEFATPTAIAFMIRHTSGLLCVAISDERADQLDLPLMVSEGDDPRGTAFTVSVDLRDGTTTGVSSADRALTIRALADWEARPGDFCRPGHVFPLRSRPGGVLKRAGHTESAVDLCRLAGLEPAGVLGEVTNDDGTMSRAPQLQRFAAKHSLSVVSVADLIQYRRENEVLVRREAEARIPSEHGEFTAISFRSAYDGVEHLALVLGEVDQRGTSTPEAVLTRVHSECLTGDVFRSHRCDCGEQLATAMARVEAAGLGVIVYLRGQEGRGIGLSHKLRAYQLQDGGLDTVEANLVQGLPIDSREYGVGAQILRELGVSRIRLMTNNPAKYRGVAAHGIVIESRETIQIAPNPHNVAYLNTKRLRLDHELRESEIS